MKGLILVAFIITVILLVIWDGVWKLIAMWKSARHDQLAWFICLAIFNTAGILPILYILYFQKPGSPPPPLAEMVISRMRRVNILPRFASSAPFLCLIVAHFEWPDMGTSTEEREYRRERAPDLVSIPPAETGKFEPSPAGARQFTHRFGLRCKRKFRQAGIFSLY